MENAAKALIMGAAVLLFVVGVSTAVFTYTRTMNATSQILTSSEKYTRTAESFNGPQVNEQRSTGRIVDGSEIVFQILNMKRSIDVEFTAITVNGVTFTPDSINDNALKQIADSNQKYEILNQDYDKKTITYGSYNDE